MPKKIDLTGHTYGLLTVIRELPKVGKYAMWLCSCECGGEKIARTMSLRSGHTQSCGCMHAAANKWRCIVHGGSDTDEYATWCRMKERCYNQNNPKYHRYGGRGITVCERWLDSFSAFLEDMGPRPSNKHSIDRIDNDRGYAPENCRWATTFVQSRNKSSNRWIEHNGVTHTLSDWANLFGIRIPTLHTKLSRGQSIADIAKSIGKYA